MIVNVMGWACPKIKKMSKRVCLDCLEYLNLNDVEVSIKFVGEKEIRRLNNNFRNVDKITDVLSFPATDTKAGQPFDNSCGNYLGDMAICLRQAKRQSKQYGTTIYAETQKLIVHSLLHLVGYDHIKDEDFELMNKREEELKIYLDGRR